VLGTKVLGLRLLGSRARQCRHLDKITQESSQQKSKDKQGSTGIKVRNSKDRNLVHSVLLPAWELMVLSLSNAIDSETLTSSYKKGCRQ
jgi:hypothetical protein